MVICENRIRYLEVRIDSGSLLIGFLACRGKKNSLVPFLSATPASHVRQVLPGFPDSKQTGSAVFYDLVLNFHPKNASLFCLLLYVLANKLRFLLAKI